jgi:hypothetical protein
VERWVGAELVQAAGGPGWAPRDPPSRSAAWLATFALQADEHPKVVAEQLGHASIRITLDTDSHVVPGMQARAAERVAGIPGPAGSGRKRTGSRLRACC